MTVRWRGKHVFDVIEAHAVEGILGGVEQNFRADHFYVDPIIGSDSASGSIAKPWKTLKKAIPYCETWKGDVIHVARGTLSVTEPVAFNVRGLIVVADQACNPGGRGESHMIYGTHTDGPAAIITQPCIIVGMGFCGSQPTGPDLLIDCDNQGGWLGGFNWLKHCRFTTWGISKYYALRTIGGQGNLIDDCLFDGSYYEKDLVGGYDVAAISMAGDVGGLHPHNVIIRDNKFVNIGPNTKYCMQFETEAIPQTVLIDHNYNMGCAKFFNNNGVTNYSTHLTDNYPNGAITEVYDETLIATLIALGVEFSNNHYHEVDP